MVAGDSSGTRRVEDVRPVLQPQDGPTAAVDDTDVQRHSVGGFQALTGRIEHGLEGRPREAQLEPKFVHREVGVPEQFRLRPVRLAHQLPPRDGLRRERARQRPTIRPTDVADHDLLLAGQSRQHGGVRSQQHRAQRNREDATQHRDVLVGDRRLVLGDAGCRVERPARNGGGASGGEHALPVGPARQRRLGRQVRRHRSVLPVVGDYFATVVGVVFFADAGAAVGVGSAGMSSGKSDTPGSPTPDTSASSPFESDESRVSASVPDVSESSSSADSDGSVGPTAAGGVAAGAGAAEVAGSGVDGLVARPVSSAGTPDATATPPAAAPGRPGRLPRAADGPGAASGRSVRSKWAAGLLR